ncbi:MAG: hypothetical protein AAF847_12135 [Bacteroidota bacterium]
MKAKFINVDLEIHSKQAMRALVRDLGDQVCVLGDGIDDKGIHYTTLELANDPEHSGSTAAQSVLALMQAYDTLLESISAAAKEEWNDATTTFDIGYHLLPDHFSQKVDLPKEVLAIASKHQSAIAVTLYKA